MTPEIKQLIDYLAAKGKPEPTDEELREIIQRETGGETGGGIYEVDLRPPWMKIGQIGDLPPTWSGQRDKK